MQLAVLFKIKSLAARVNIEMMRSNVKLSLPMHVLFAFNAYMHAYGQYICMHVAAFYLATVLQQRHLRVAETLISFCSHNQKFSLGHLAAWPLQPGKKQQHKNKTRLTLRIAAKITTIGDKYAVTVLTTAVFGSTAKTLTCLNVSL